MSGWQRESQVHIVFWFWISLVFGITRRIVRDIKPGRSWVNNQVSSAWRSRQPGNKRNNCSGYWAKTRWKLPGPPPPPAPAPGHKPNNCSPVPWNTSSGFGVRDSGFGLRASGSGLAAAASYTGPLFFHAHMHPPSRSIIKKNEQLFFLGFTYAMIAC